MVKPRLKPWSGAALLSKIRESLRDGRYQVTYHVELRCVERGVTLPDVFQVLETGRHEPRKDQFDAVEQEWHYAILGKTTDKVNLRVAVLFDDDGMLVLTVVNLSVKDERQ